MTNVFVKICGITNLDDALRSVDARADALGFIFHPKSPRFITPEAAGRIIEKLPEYTTKVGVFVDSDSREVNRISQEIKLSAVQIHGDVTPSELHQYEVSIIRALQVHETFDVRVLATLQVEAFLLDAYEEGKHGGTGKTFDWNIARKANPYGKIILSGGLNPRNVDEAVRFVRPYGVDVSSGVEERPGKKDAKKLKEFILRAKSNRS